MNPFLIQPRHGFAVLLSILIISCNNSANAPESSGDSGNAVAPEKRVKKRPATHVSNHSPRSLTGLNNFCLGPSPGPEEHGHATNFNISVDISEDSTANISLLYKCTGQQHPIPPPYSGKPKTTVFLYDYETQISIDVVGNKKNLTITKDAFKGAVKDTVLKYGTIADVPEFEEYDEEMHSFKFSFLISIPTMSADYSQFVELIVDDKGNYHSNAVTTPPIVQDVVEE